MPSVRRPSSSCSRRAAGWQKANNSGLSGVCVPLVVFPVGTGKQNAENAAIEGRGARQKCPKGFLAHLSTGKLRIFPILTHDLSFLF
jgi:hypothetical protein